MRAMYLALGLAPLLAGCGWLWPKDNPCDPANGDARCVDASSPTEVGPPDDLRRLLDVGIDQSSQPDTGVGCDANPNLAGLTLDDGDCVVYRIPLKNGATDHAGAVAIRASADHAFTYGGSASPFQAEVMEWLTATGGTPADYFSYEIPNVHSGILHAGYLAFSSKGDVAVGHNAVAQDVLLSELHWARQGDAKTINMINNDAVFSGPDTLLVSGSSGGTWGLYVVTRDPSTNLLYEYDYTQEAFLALGKDVLFVGKEAIFAFARSVVQDAVTRKEPLPSGTRLLQKQSPFDMTAVGNDLLLLVRAATKQVDLIPITVTATDISTGTRRTLVSASSGTDIVALEGVAEGAFWGFGLLLKTGTQEEVVLIRRH